MWYIKVMKYGLIILMLIGVSAAVFSFFNFYKKPITPVTPITEINTVETKEALPAQAGLPVEVATKREAIYQAALSRNYETLAKEAGADFYYSFGGEYEGGFVEYLKLSEKDEKESAFDIIPTLLALPYAKIDDLYVWPSVYTVEPSKWTSEDIAIMKTFLTEKQIEDFREFGGYIYYRLAITSSGEWVYYLAGD